MPGCRAVSVDPLTGSNAALRCFWLTAVSPINQYISERLKGQQLLLQYVYRLIGKRHQLYSPAATHHALSIMWGSFRNGSLLYQRLAIKYLIIFDFQSIAFIATLRKRITRLQIETRWR